MVGSCGVKMATALSYRFDEQLKMSQGISVSRSVHDILMKHIPGARRAYQADNSSDRNGTDWWVEHTSGKHISVDVKIRKMDWARRGRDDLALETWSVVERKKVGWTRDHAKRTDYIMWLWKDTGRWCIVPFTMLCAVFSESWEKWATKFESKQQHTPDGNYHSECVFVPRR